MYPGAKEELPKKMPKALGKEVEISTYVDASFASDIKNRRSVTGIIIFLNNTPIKWYSKRQNTIETSTFGAELVAARIATELIMETRYKLRMLGIPIKKNATILFGDNKSVVMNMTLPSSSLKKRHNAIAYHFIRKAVAAGILNFIHIPTTENIADVLTKQLPVNKFYDLLRPLLFNPISDSGE